LSKEQQTEQYLKYCNSNIYPNDWTQFPLALENFSFENGLILVIYLESNVI